MMKKFAVLLAAAVLSGLLPCGSLYAQETSSAEDPQEQSAETEVVETELAETEAEERVTVPENRPEYQALDYVRSMTMSTKRSSFWSIRLRMIRRKPGQIIRQTLTR